MANTKPTQASSWWRKYGVISITGMWLAACIALLSYFAESGVSTFDHSNSLFYQANAPEFDQRFSALISSQIGDVKNAIVHFSDQECWCQFVGETHIASVVELAKNSGLQNHKIEKAQMSSSVSKLIPSFPAVALFNAEGRLAYLGPYSSGIYCSVGNGMIEPFIKKISNAPNSAAIPMDAEGCYCKNESSKSIT
ncbi:MAG: hypothetical protein GJ680_18770 [Alteromonadaceae bacterium]|nr:hypothetical protein [Alteromonadaceae bacterium]